MKNFISVILLVLSFNLTAEVRINHKNVLQVYSEVPELQSRLHAISYGSSGVDMTEYKVRSTATGVFSLEYLFTHDVTEITCVECSELNIVSEINYNDEANYYASVHSYSTQVYLTSGVTYTFTMRSVSMKDSVVAQGVFFDLIE